MQQQRFGYLAWAVGFIKILLSIATGMWTVNPQARSACMTRCWRDVKSPWTLKRPGRKPPRGTTLTLGNISGNSHMNTSPAVTCSTTQMPD